jgi:hypothetical protein
MDVLIDDKRMSMQPEEVPCLFDLLAAKKEEK